MKSSKFESVTKSSAQQASIPSSPQTDGRRLSTSSPVGTAPLCACGCGQTPKWNPRRKRWGRYILGHRKGSNPTEYESWKASMRPRTPQATAPLCLCGCGIPVRPHLWGAGRFWANYLKNHQLRGRTGVISAAARERISQRMRTNNPMRDPLVALKANRARMLAQSPTKVELRFSRWSKDRAIPISFRGTGKLWIDRRNPDFRVIGQKKIIEVTTRGIFNGGTVEDRTPESYGAAAIKHYTKSGWACLVVFCPEDYRHRLPDTLLPVITDFCSKASSWSGVWNFDRLIRFAGSSGECASTTSRARRLKPTKQTA